MTKPICKVISIFQKKTTMRLSEIEWSSLKEICEFEKMKRKNLLEMVDKYRHKNLSFTSAVRVFELAYFRNASRSLLSKKEGIKSRKNLLDALYLLQNK